MRRYLVTTTFLASFVSLAHAQTVQSGTMAAWDGYANGDARLDLVMAQTPAGTTHQWAVGRRTHLTAHSHASGIPAAAGL